MPENGFSHIAFSDESHWNTGRYRGISIVTMLAHNYLRLNEELTRIISASGTDEFGFKKLDDSRYRRLAEQLCDFAIRKVRTNDIRIDILTWDTQDERHDIRFRDDIRNFHIMYFHVFRNVFKRRWSDDAIWRLCPDEQEQMDWADLNEHLNGASIEGQIIQRPSGFSQYSVEFKRNFRISDICPRQSHLEPFIQLADLFVGLGVYSREHYDTIERWLAINNTQKMLIETDDNEEQNTSFSRSHHQRCPLATSFYSRCKDNSLNVSLRTFKGFKTRDPSKPINFWWYTPQHESDRAPTTRQQTF